MLEKILGTRTFLTAEGALDGLSARHSAIADNISNANTPGYKRKIVPFEAALQSAVDRAVSPCSDTACGPHQRFVPTTTLDSSGATRADLNGVTIEQEMVDLADNAIRYQTLTQYVTGYFAGLKSVIRGG